MTAKLEPFAAAPAMMKAWMAVSNTANSSLEPLLAELVKIRASQINQCANCINMHTLDARALGETEQRINLIAAWREAPYYTERERAALAWTEALTLIAQGVSDDVYAEARAQFSEQELMYLSSAIAGINVWNRFGAAYRWTPPLRG